MDPEHTLQKLKHILCKWEVFQKQQNTVRVEGTTCTIHNMLYNLG